MLTLEQLFPTKLVERDHDRVNTYVEQLPEGRVMMIEAGDRYVMVRKHDHAHNILEVIRFCSESLATIEAIRGWAIKLVTTRYGYSSTWQVAWGSEGPHDVGVLLHPYPGTVNRGNPQRMSGRHVSFDLGAYTPYAIEWYPNYGDVEEYWPRHRAQLKLCIMQIYTMRMLQPCARMLKGKILDQCQDAWLKDFNRKYDSVYGKTGYRLRELTIASQNALTRFIIWMRRYTDSIWCTVPIEICRLIASHCRQYALA
jgi:hypothetical protein